MDRDTIHYEYVDLIETYEARTLPLCTGPSLRPSFSSTEPCHHEDAIVNARLSRYLAAAREDAERLKNWRSAAWLVTLREIVENPAPAITRDEFALLVGDEKAF